MNNECKCVECCDNCCGICVMRGPQGPRELQGAKGDQGEQGIQGEQGERGPIGPQGIQGIQGDIGLPGPQGAQGEKGDKGDPGVQGAKGDKGDQGEQGPMGPQGIQGIAGPKGDKGDPGEPGAQGEKGDKGDQGEQGEKGDVGPQGPIGPQGPQGESGNAAACACVQQLSNLLSQFISIYPNDNLIFSLESGSTVSGIIGSLLPAPNDNPNAGLVQLVNSQGDITEAISLCRIASVRVNSAAYSNNLTYLPEPTPAPGGCAADCERAVRAYLPIGTAGVAINEGGKTVGQGTVIRNAYGVVVLSGANDSDPTFVSTCKAEVITK